MNGQLYRFVRLPMGFSGACEIMQQITQLLVTETLSSIGNPCTITSDVYIDNVLFICKTADMAKTVFDSFQRVCRSYNVTIGSSELCPQIFTYRGVTIDLQKLTLRIKPSFVHKCQTHISTACIRRRLSTAQFSGLMGELSYAESLIRPYPQRRFYHCYGIWTTTAIHQKSRLILRAPQINELTACRLWLSREIPISTFAPTTTVKSLAASDASTIGLAYVSFLPQPIVHYKSYASLAPDINNTELKVLIDAMNDPLHKQPGRLFISDNTQALRCVTRRYSSNARMFNTLMKLDMRFVSDNFAWIQSALNPADAPSRLMPITRVSLPRLDKFG